MRLPALLSSMIFAISCQPRPSAPPASPPSPSAERGRQERVVGGAVGHEHHPGGVPPGDRHPCDPFTRRKPAASPPSPEAVCGNGVIDETVGPCVEVCSGGCGEPVECKVECDRFSEACDGRQLEASCVSQDYAAGRMACSPRCELDAAACVACVPGPGVRCGAVKLSGDQVDLVAGANGAAVFVRDADTGKITGARVDAALRATRFTGLPTRTLAAAALDGRLGFVDAKRRFGTIDPGTGRARVHGPIGGTSSNITIARETSRAGGAAVLTSDNGQLALAMFDGPAPAARDQPRQFYLDNRQVMVIPGAHALARGATTGGADLVVVAFGGAPVAYQRDGLALTRLPNVPPGIALTTVPRVDADYDLEAPPPGLSAMALAGARMVRAFGGVLMANQRADARTPRTELYWHAGAAPAAPSP